VSQRQGQGGFIRDVLIYGLGDFIARSANLLVIPIYARLFTPDEYGERNLLLTLAGLLASFVALGMDTAYARLFYDDDRREYRIALTSTALWFMLWWGCLAIAVVCWFSPTLTRLALGSAGDTQLAQLAFASVPFSLLSTLCSQVLRNTFQSRLFTLTNILTTFTNISLGFIGAVVWEWGIAGLLFGSLAAQLALLPLRLWLIRELLGWRFDPKLLAGLLQVGVPLVPVSLAYWIFSTSDCVVISHFASLADNGMYALANQVAPMHSCCFAMTQTVLATFSGRQH
jgi:O-antigen/teichoic acid export membrane protein